MALKLTPPKAILLAVQLAVQGDVGSLSLLAQRYHKVLHKALLLQILLTYLPETVPSSTYVEFLDEIEKNEVTERAPVEIDSSAVDSLIDKEASKQVRRLRLQSLDSIDSRLPEDVDVMTQFLLRRAYMVDEEAGLLHEVRDLLLPFIDHSPYIRSLMVSTILPLLRRNYEYYPQNPLSYTLSDFEALPAALAVQALLSQSGVRDEHLPHVGRDLKGLIGPWLFNESRWSSRKLVQEQTSPGNGEGYESLCPGWHRVLEWLLAQASKRWKVAVQAIEQWEGPGAVDLNGWGFMWLNEKEQKYLEETYARAGLGAAYLVSEPTMEALEGAYRIATKIAGLIDQHPYDQVPCPQLQIAAALLAPVSVEDLDGLITARNASYVRSDVLRASNVLTAPTRRSASFLQALILSAFLLTRAGSPCSVRRASELVLLQIERDQKAEAIQFVHAASYNASRNDDQHWNTIRNELLWLREWGVQPSSRSGIHGVFSHVQRDFLEVEILKCLLANARYSLARSIYEDSPYRPIPQKALQDTVLAAAMTAYDSASNPNRTRGGLKKCHDIIKAFPRTIEESSAAARKMEALFQATHALSDYRLVLKQGEPFTPVLLRLHPDPISIAGKILEQNPGSYSRVRELLDIGANMVQAGLTLRDKAGNRVLTPEQEPVQGFIAERRITAMCVDAALVEDDFETAYSYVVNRIATGTKPYPQVPGSSHPAMDEYSWKAALQAGKYRRTSRTVRPTHLGTASGNAEIRHLEQRIECLATALRIAPSATLTEIVNAFRRVEEELQAAERVEHDQEEAWDAAGDDMREQRGIPGSFGSWPVTKTSAAPTSSSRRTEDKEAPMSLFDLSRASVMSAQRNLTALRSLQRSVTGLGKRSNSSLEKESTAMGSEVEGEGEGEGEGEDGQPTRVRKRDQLREAAMGKLVSGVGWLINAPTQQGN